VKRSDLPDTKKAPTGDCNLADAKQKANGRKSSTIPETAPDPLCTAKTEARSAEETPSKSILKPAETAEVKSIPTPSPNLKPAATVQSNENETPKPVSTVEDDAEEPSPEYRVATVEVTDREPQLKPVTRAEGFHNEVTSKQSLKMDENVASLSRKSSYMAPEAATRTEVELLCDLDNEKLAELKEVRAIVFFPS
jgi:hypothetical protein